MTAEVAIISRVAVALAADSAMTVSGAGSSAKIYNTAEKIFELTAHDPIGLMIYNNLDFMGVPIDVAIKMFRQSARCKKCVNVEEMAENFLVFLIEEIKPDEEAQKRHVRFVSSGLFRYVRGELEERMERMLSKAGSRRVDPQKILWAILNESVSEFEKAAPAAGFDEVTDESLEERYKSAIDDGVRDWFSGFPLKEAEWKLSRRMVVAYLRRDLFSSSFTGLVFAGYAGEDLFPSLVAYEIDGVVAGKIKKRRTLNRVINSTDLTADILPFAQHDMADRFLFGIDPDFESALPDFLKERLRDTGLAIIDQAGTTPAKADDLRSKLNEAVDKTVKKFKEELMADVKAFFKNQVSGMVSIMPKKELADFAESLVNFTSIKRRVSAEQETVGGPVDVAVISRSDGFVWVRRKHYFERELNPKFFTRKYPNRVA